MAFSKENTQFTICFAVHAISKICMQFKFVCLFLFCLQNYHKPEMHSNRIWIRSDTRKLPNGKLTIEKKTFLTNFHLQNTIVRHLRCLENVQNSKYLNVRQDTDLSPFICINLSVFCLFWSVSNKTRWNIWNIQYI